MNKTLSDRSSEGLIYPNPVATKISLLAGAILAVIAMAAIFACGSEIRSSTQLYRIIGDAISSPHPLDNIWIKLGIGISPVTVHPPQVPPQISPSPTKRNGKQTQSLAPVAPADAAGASEQLPHSSFDEKQYLIAASVISTLIFLPIFASYVLWAGALALVRIGKGFVDWRNTGLAKTRQQIWTLRHSLLYVKQY